MNKEIDKIEKDTIIYLLEHESCPQRHLAEAMGCSLGKMNQILKKLKENGYIDAENRPVQHTKDLVECNSPKRAIILAAGSGMRMVPINTEVSKGLLQVKGEVLIERVIRQLKEKGITDITIVVGFMKEQYEYLIDQYQVDLVVNSQYAKRNNLYSLYLVRERLENAYIIPCDIWCEKNIFRIKELYSWYLVQEKKTKESNVYLNGKNQLVRLRPQENGNVMIGIAYLNSKDAIIVKERLERLENDEAYRDCFWEEALWEGKRFLIYGRVDDAKSAYEINTYEELRELDASTKNLESDIVKLVADVFQTDTREIRQIEVLKKGMTNRSFQFSYLDKRYIMRIPGEGTDFLINRRQEYDVYEAIKDADICDRIYYLNPDNGYKITEYLEGVRICDPYQEADVRACMRFLREFHQKNIKVAHTFDLYGKIDYYEGLWEGKPSCYQDYEKTKEQVFQLKGYIDSIEKEITLTHVDAVPDNFLIKGDRIYLIDWEYAGMQDPHLDIAMFAAYALYPERSYVDALIDAYFEGECPKQTRIKIYCYLSAVGLLWSNWCEYKSGLGVEFGEYSLRQYRFAKDYYKIVQEELKSVN